MTLPIIEIEGLGKKYQLGAHKEPYLSIRDSLVRSVKGIGKKLSRLTTHNSQLTTHNSPEDFWALRDVSFSVQEGEAVGIIGRNGAGKSTLLKILSQITPPTEGKITCRGRIASLLEVGTGFHPELTGRENIYLNGAILGMTRAEIKRKFDEIVAFSEVEKFLDTPVKRYSSGMYVRLAFAVAAHLDPEILVVDEVLAVGDAQFQKKCLGKMGEVAKGGRTVLFVSHNMGAISQLCQSVALLNRGQLLAMGSTEKIVAEYLAHGSSTSAFVDHTSRVGREGSGNVCIESACLKAINGGLSNQFSIGDDMILELGIARISYVSTIRMGVTLIASDGLKIAQMVDTDSNFDWHNIGERETVLLTFHDLRLYPGTYMFNIWIGAGDSRECYDAVENCVRFDVVSGGLLTTRPLPRSTGIFYLTPDWSRKIDSDTSTS